MEYVVGVDIGGTCTDCVVVDGDGNVNLGKAFSTPPDFSVGILDALGIAAQQLGAEAGAVLASTRLFLHSTTVAENAVVDGTLARAGVITTRGFEDTLFAMRGGFGRWSGLTEDEKRNPIETDKPPPIVPRSLVVGIHERTDARGDVKAAATDGEIEQAVRTLVADGVEAIGVSTLWSFANPATERQVAEVAKRVAPDVFLTLSHEIAPVVGEYERTSTVALNARLEPVVHGYLDSLRAKLAEHGFSGQLLVAQAYGGLLPVDEAATRPVGMIESGPVSGLVGSQSLGEQLGLRNIIAADMGGTTFKVGTVREGLIEYQRESLVLRYHYALPKMDVVSLGLAGGSIVSVDERTGVPRIGPKSAGSYPGPVCYAHGGEEPTITDIDAILGYLNPRYFLGGRAELDVPKARRLFQEKVAEPLGLELVAAAAAMYKLANSLFYDLLHKTTVQRGLDPRRFALLSFGGTAGMHVGAYGEDLGVSTIVIPYSASVHGAFGLVKSDIAHEDQITRPLRAPFDLGAIEESYALLEARITRQLVAEGFERSQMRAPPRRRHALPPPGAHPDLTLRRRRRQPELARAHDRAVRAALRGEVRAAVRIPRGGDRARELPCPRRGGGEQAGAQRRAARRRGSVDRPGRAGRGVGGQGRRAPGCARLRLRAAAPRQRRPRSGDRLDADHDARGSTRPGGAAGRAP